MKVKTRGPWPAALLGRAGPGGGRAPGWPGVSRVKMADTANRDQRQSHKIQATCLLSDQIQPLPSVSVVCGQHCVSSVCLVCAKEGLLRESEIIISYERLEGNVWVRGEEEGRGRRQCWDDLSVLWIKWGPLGVPGPVPPVP